MTDTFVMPTPGGDNDVWGGKLNQILPLIESPAYNITAPEFEASGNGVDDDTTAINAAIAAKAAAGGGIVYVPEGVFLYSEINLASNVEVWGAGRKSMLKFKAGTNTDDALRGASIQDAGLRYLCVDYNHQNNAGSDIGMRIDGSLRVTIEGCWFLNARGFAISLAGLPTSRNEHCNVFNNWVLNPISGSNDMLLVVSDWGKVAGNHVIGVDANIALVLYESDHLKAWENVVELASGSGHTGIGVLSCRFSSILDNKVAGADNGIGIGLYTEHDNPDPVASERNTLALNQMSHVGSGIQVLETNYDRIILNRVEHATNGIEFPATAQPDAGNLLQLFNDLRYNVTNPIANTGGANVNLFTGVGMIGNSAAATTPGSVTKKLEVYDQGGTLLGYIPVYSSIS